MAFGCAKTDNYTIGSRFFLDLAVPFEGLLCKIDMKPSVKLMWSNFTGSSRAMAVEQSTSKTFVSNFASKQLCFLLLGAPTLQIRREFCRCGALFPLCHPACTRKFSCDFKYTIFCRKLGRGFEKFPVLISLPFIWRRGLSGIWGGNKSTRRIITRKGPFKASKDALKNSENLKTKGKNKGKKIPQQDITVCGNRRTVTYVRIYYSGGFHYGQVYF